VSSDRLAGALQALSEADLVRLKRIAQFRARGLPGVQWSDLLNEAVLRALQGSRRWPEQVPVVAFLALVMRSLADEYWRQHRVQAALLQTDALARLPDGAPGPERELAARQCLMEIDSLFARDEDALRVIAGLADGLTAPEIQRLYGMDATRYATTRRRIRRALQRNYAEGYGP